MSQNLVDLNLAPESPAAISNSIASLESLLQGLIALEPQQRRELTKMGDKSEAFCRQAVVAFGDNPDVLPRNFDLDGFRSDLATLDALRPIVGRIGKLYQRLIDTEMALGSDLMNNALEGYAVLKVAGKGEGLDIMRKMLAARFNRRRTEEVPDGSQSNS
jgi:hypothetical protein